MNRPPLPQSPAFDAMAEFASIEPLAEAIKAEIRTRLNQRRGFDVAAGVMSYREAIEKHCQAYGLDVEQEVARVLSMRTYAHSLKAIAEIEP